MTPRAHLAWGVLFALVALALCVASVGSPAPWSALVAAGVGCLASLWHLTQWAERR